jgi:hypothetical protein
VERTPFSAAFSQIPSIHAKSASSCTNLDDAWDLAGSSLGLQTTGAKSEA